MASKSYKVTGPLAVPFREDGTSVYLYEGAEWPDGLREGETERFVDLGLVGEVEETKPASKSSK